MHVRPAVLDDAPSIATIYNAASAVTPAANLVTWQESVEDRKQWLAQMEKDDYPVFVAVDDDEIVGWAAYFQFVTPAIYYGTAEDSVYIAESARGKGVGSELMATLMDHAQDNDYVQTMITYIVDTNEASIALHKKFGFVETGRMPNIHTKDGVRLGLVHLQRDFDRS
ncbi:GNAT family N-acetyltransferase [uncultured Corynebacterium sp.]|uniref:GNAT family N-acetyltransferase n=1 Tax=uncultured Corynebacterium sp. TaxID=159447 RepID=UPI0025E72521|nr:GNAT family N-acetyltransferase [uncultured Corynebacterium sp.]